MGSVLMFQDQKVPGLDKRPHQQDEGRKKWGKGSKCTKNVLDL